MRLIIPAIETVRLTEHWHVAKDGDPRGLELYERHYSAHKYKDGRIRKLFCGPGEKLVLLTGCGMAIWVWRKFIDDSGQDGVNCAVFRNESGLGGIQLVAEADRVAECRWPGERRYTYVDPTAINSTNPGFVFKANGYRFEGVTKGGLHILAKTSVGVERKAG